MSPERWSYHYRFAIFNIGGLNKSNQFGIGFFIITPSVTMKATCLVIFRQQFTFKKYLTLSLTFFFPSFNATSINKIE